MPDASAGYGVKRLAFEITFLATNSLGCLNHSSLGKDLKYS